MSSGESDRNEDSIPIYIDPEKTEENVTLEYAVESTEMARRVEEAYRRGFADALVKVCENLLKDGFSPFGVYKAIRASAKK